MKTNVTGHNVQFFFWGGGGFHRRSKKPSFPQDALPNRTPHQASSHHSQQVQIYKTHRFTLQCDTLRALNHRELHAVVRKKTSPTTSLILANFKTLSPHSHSFVFLLPRHFTTPIFHIICSRQHKLLIFIRAQILSLLNLLPPCSCPLSF